MKMECEMGMVLACQVEECSFNGNRECRAGEIHVGGDGGHPACDTFTTDSVDRQQKSPMVNACDIISCKHNNQMQDCRAPAVSLGHHAQHADCDSFVPRP